MLFYRFLCSLFRPGSALNRYKNRWHTLLTGLYMAPPTQRLLVSIFITMLALSGGSLRYEQTSGLSIQLWAVNGAFALESLERIFKDDFEDAPITLQSPSSGDSLCAADVTLTGHVEDTVVQLLIDGVDTPLNNLQFTSAPVMLLDGSNELVLEAVIAGGGSKFMLATINRVPFTHPVNTDLLDITIPSGQNSTVSGFPLAANAGASVTITNKRTSAAVLVSADNIGAFSTSIGAQPDDELTLVAEEQNICPPASAVSAVVPDSNQPPVLNAIGNKVVYLGQSLGFTVSATDPDGDDLSFSGFPLPAGASLDAVSGDFLFHPTEGQAGVVNVEFSVSDGIAGDSEMISITVNPAPNAGVTKMSGRVVDTTDFVNNGTLTPVVGATVSIMNSGVSAVTAADGTFTLSPIPAGEQLFDIDPTGTTAPDGSDYAGFREALTIIDKVDNQHTRPFFLPRIAMASVKNVNPDAKTIIRNDALGVRIEIPAHTAKWIDGSDYDGPMSISEVPDAVAPAALPPNLGFGLLVTIQPVGVYFVSPVPIFFPNGDGLPDGSIVDIWSLDGGTGAFTVVGKAEVVNGELKTVSGGVVSADWHGPLAGGTTQTTDEDPETCDACQKLKAMTGSETTLGQGSLSVRHDLVPYQSVGQWRAPSLVYNSTNADPRPVVTTKGTLPQPAPQALTVSISSQGVGGSSEIDYETSALERFDQVQLAGQFDGSALPSGIYDYALDIRNHFAFSSVATRQQGRVIINNLSASPMGSGWGVAGLNRLLEQPDQSMLMTGGDGSARIYTALFEGSGNFAGPDVKTIASWTRGKPAIGDINNDNNLDFIVPVSNSTFGWVRLEVYLNDGSGGFAYSTFTPVGNPNAIALADFNKDSKLDLIVMDHNTGQIHLGDGLGGFGLPTEFTANAGTERAVVVADFNNDTNLDIAYGNGRVNTKTISIQLGDGAGGFAAQTHIEIVRGRVLDLSSADFNNDNKADIVVAADPNTTGWVDVFLGDGAGGFAAPLELPAGTRPSWVVSGDFDLDNKADILVAGSNAVSVIYGNGDGTFTAEETSPLTGGAACISVADFDGNGNPDFAVGNSGQNVVSLFDGNGMGGFPVRRRLAVGYQTTCLVTADFNNDSLDDIVVLHGGANARTLSIHLSDGPNNLSGVVTVPETAQDGSGFQGIVIADFNEDSLPDAAVAKRNNLEVYLGDGTDFNLATATFVHQDSQQIQQADFNADGHIDLAFFRSSFASKQGIEVRLGDGLGGFETIVRSNYPDGEFVSPVSNLNAGDINQDGLPDLVFSSGSVQHKIHAMLGDGTGSFAWVAPRDVANRAEDLKIVDVMGDAQKEVVAYNWAESVVPFEYDGIGALVSLGPVSKIGVFAANFDFGDVNGDGIVDVVTVNGSGGLLGKLSVGIGDGTGVFTDLGDVDMCISNSGFNSPVKYVSLADIDNDGDLDAAFTCTSNLIVGTALNDGTGVFTKHQELITAGIHDLAVGDFNLDGAIDLVSVSDTGLDVHHNIPTANRVGLRSPSSDFSVLTPNLNGTFTRQEKDGMVTGFDTDGLQTSITDRNGNTTTYQYDGLDRLTKIIDPLAKETTFAYTGSLLSGITGPAGRVTQFTHDGDGNLTSITDPDTSVRQFEYDSRHRLTKQTSKRGFDTRYDYNEYGTNWRTIRADGSVVLVKPSATAALPEPGSSSKVLQALLTDEVAATLIDARGATWTFATNRFESSTLQTDPLGRVSRVIRNGNNLPLRTVSPADVITTRKYDDNGNLVALGEAVGTAAERWVYMRYEPEFNNVIMASDPAGATDLFEYDVEGNLIRQVDPMGEERLFSYDARGLMLSHTDANTNVSTATYDASGNITARVDALFRTTAFGHDPAGNIISIEVGVGTLEAAQYAFTYDSMNRLTRLTDPNGNIQSWTYDAAGNQATHKLASGETELFGYDELDRAISTDSPRRGISTLDYDANGNLIATTDGRGDTRVFEYDSADQLTRKTDGAGAVDSFVHDADGRIVATTNGNGHTTTMNHDALGRIVDVVEPTLNQVTFGYDARDQLKSATNANGAVFNYSYDPLQRLLSRAAPDDTVNYGYDAVGNVTSVSDNDSALNFGFDASNRLNQVATGAAAAGQPVVTLDYTYDATGNRIGVTDSESGITTTNRDGAGRLTSIQTAGGDVISLGYDAANRLTVVQRPNGVDSTYTYDAQGKLVDVDHGLLGGVAYSHDGAGDIDSADDAVRNASYTYDAAGRLVLADSKVGPESYNYDGEGNRTDSHLSGSYTYDSVNRLLANDSFTYSYDAAGHLLQRTSAGSGLSEDFAWDSAGHLIQYTDTAGIVSTYRYDALGRRITRTVDGTTTGYVYDGRVIRDEFANNSTLAAQYDHGDQVDQLLTQARGGQQFFYLTDHQNSVTGLTNAAGALINEYRYDSFGRSLSAISSVDNPFRYTGREFDAESGMYFNRARYYDPDTGRFITPDPLGPLTGESNLYVYVSNNPLNQRDPSGLSPEDDFMLAVDSVETLVGLALENVPAAGTFLKIFAILKDGFTTGSEPAELINGGLSIFVTLAAEGALGPWGAVAVLGGKIGKKIIDDYGDSLLALEDSKNAAARSAGLRIRRIGDNNRRRAAHASGQILEALCALQEGRKRIQKRINSGKYWNSRSEEDWRLKNNQATREQLNKALQDINQSPADASEILDNVATLVDYAR